MTTREEYALAADYEEWLASIGLKSDPAKRTHALAARVLRALAEGAVLCREEIDSVQTQVIGLKITSYVPIEEQP
jgi:hypothetical protein